jgi:hypothetical protein
LRGLYVFCAWLNHTDAKSINSMDSLVVKPIVAQLVSFGFYAPAWMRADFPHVPAIGNFEYRAFDAEQWHSNYQNTAFELRTPGDTYWAAKKVMAFSDNAIRAHSADGAVRGCARGGMGCALFDRTAQPHRPRVFP